MSFFKAAPALGAVMLLMACSKAPTASNAKPSEAELVEAYRQAHDHHDLQAMMKLFCWDRVSPEVRKQTEEIEEGKLAFKISDIRTTTGEPLERMKKVSYVKDGLTYRFNLPVVAALAVHFPPLPKEAESVDYYPLGVKGGRYMIALTAPIE